MIIYLGSFYILLGSVFLLIPLIYLEVGRPKDLIKAALNLIIGIVLIIKNKFFEDFSFAIFFAITLLIIFYLIEIFSYRWNQLTDKEKNKITTLIELKKNLSKILEAFALGVKNFVNFFDFDKSNENINKKKWVRNDKNDNIKV